MSTTINWKKGIDLPEWRQLSPALVASTAGSSIAYDLRNNLHRFPHLLFLTAVNSASIYDPLRDNAVSISSPALAGTFGAGACATFHAGHGPSGTLAAGASTTKVILTTALPFAVGLNSMANKGDGLGWYIRITGSASGSSGKVEYRRIVANTAGTTPTIWLDSALSFTPASGDAYRIECGKFYLLSAGTTASGTFKSLDPLTFQYTTLAQAILPATINVDSAFVPLADNYVPYNRQPGEGFLGTSTYSDGLKCLTASATTANTITIGSGGDANMAASEYINFTVRVVEDTAIPTAVGQVRKITANTGGATGAFTLISNWTATPSATAKFVIENDNDVTLLFTSGAATVYNYSLSNAGWYTGTHTTRVSAVGAGVTGAQAFGIVPDTNRNAKHALIYSMRGGGGNMDVYDISTNTWSLAVTNYGYAGFGASYPSLAAGSCWVYDPIANEGRFAYLSLGTNRMLVYDLLTRTFNTFSYQRITTGSAVAGEHVALVAFIDGTTKVTMVNEWMRSTTTVLQAPCLGVL